MSKGSTPRPFSVSNEEYASRWDAIFGRDQPKEKPSACPKCGDENYSVHHIKPGHGDPSETYCICNQCQHEFDGKTQKD